MEEKKPEPKSPETTDAKSLTETKDVKPTKSAVKKDHKKSKSHKKHHKKHKKQKEESSSSSSSSDDDETHVAMDEQQTVTPPKPKIQVVKEECPQLVQQQCPKCTIQPIIELSQQGGKDFSFTPENTDILNPENLQFKIVPSNNRDQVNSIDVIDNQKILGFSTYNNLLTDGAKHDITDSDADYYNVTVNLVVKRMSQFEADAKHKKYAQSIAQKGGVMANASVPSGGNTKSEGQTEQDKEKDAT